MTGKERDRAIRYTEAVTIQMPPGFRESVDRVALTKGLKSTEYMRQILKTALEAENIGAGASDKIRDPLAERGYREMTSASWLGR